MAQQTAIVDQRQSRADPRLQRVIRVPEVLEPDDVVLAIELLPYMRSRLGARFSQSVLVYGDQLVCDLTPVGNRKRAQLREMTMQGRTVAQEWQDGGCAGVRVPRGQCGGPTGHLRQRRLRSEQAGQAGAGRLERE